MAAFFKVKWLSISFTVLYVTLAVADLAVAVSWYVDGVRTGPVTSWLNYNRILEVLIALGFLLGVVGICGCVASLNETLGLLILSTVSVVFVACGFTVVAVWLRKELPKAETGLRETMNMEISTYNQSADINATTLFWDDLQRKYNCCGIDSSSDWIQQSPQQLIPESCSMQKVHSATGDLPGCFEESLVTARKAVKGGLICTAVMAGLLFAGFIFNIFYCMALRGMRNKEL